MKQKEQSGIKGLGSALNMYDNILEFPQSSSRKVYIRHIDIGTGTTIDTTKVGNGIKLTPPAAQKYILAGTSKKTTTASFGLYSEYYENISVTDSITKYALKLDDINCLGYNVAISSDLAQAISVINSQVAQGTYVESDTAFVRGKSISSDDDIVVLEFYYNENDEEKLEEIDKPVDNLPGHVFVIPTPEQSDTKIYNGLCNDTELNPTISFPSGHNARVGIEDIPKSMAGAINLSKKEVEGTFKLTFKIKRGSFDDSITYNFNYSVPYYTVTNMLVYKFKEGTIYDAGSGYEGTQGSSMFSWNTLTTNDEKDELLIKDKSEPLNVILKGLNGQIENTNTAIGDINNYVSAHLNISDPINTGLNVNNNLDIIDKNSLEIEIVNIGNDEWNKVDINNDGELTIVDKTSVETLKKNSDDAYDKAEEAKTKWKNEVAKKAEADKAIGQAESAVESAEEDLAEKTNKVQELIDELSEFKASLIADGIVAKENKAPNYDLLDQGDVNNLMSKLPEGIEYLVADLNKSGYPWNSFYNKWGVTSQNWSQYTKGCANNIKEKYNSTKWKKYKDAQEALYTARNNLVKIKEQYKNAPTQSQCDSLYSIYLNANQTYEDLNDTFKAITSDYNDWLSLYNATKEKLALYEKIKQQVTTINQQTIASLYNIYVDIKAKSMDVTIDDKSLYPVQAEQQDSIYFNGFNILRAENTYEKSYTLDMGAVPSIDQKLYSNLTGNLIGRDNYENSSLVKSSITNGIRWIKGEVKYDTEIIIGDKNINQVNDTAFEEGKTFSVDKKYVLKKTYTVKSDATTLEDKYKEVNPINVYTPITVESTIESEQNQIVNQTTGNFEIPVIQINTPFTVKITNNNSEAVYSYASTQKYNKGYYIKFDFDVHNVRIDGKIYKNGERIPAGTWIGFLSVEEKTKDKNLEDIDIDTTTINVSAQAYGSTKENTLNPVSDEKNSYTVRAVAYNATDLMRNVSKLYPTLEDFKNSTHGEMIANICNHPSYFAEETNEIVIINRLYDFRVTDVKDIEWKNSFRTTSGSDVNKHTGNVYYAGITKWDTSSSREVNKIINRTVSEIGRNPLRILPIGPYKNTDISKLKAPKLGYRISFDFKVTGSYYNSDGTIHENKTANVKTKFYYVSKDGKTFIEESNGGKGIYLFYKNSNGKYVRIDSNGGNYNLTYTPYDGYRYISDSTTDTLSKKSVSLGNLRNMTFKYDMATPINNRGAITYYGEYKLPNSTIAVEVDSNGKYDINKPLTDGYIGVIFDIYSNTGTITQNGVTKQVILRYSQNTENEPNTSQWDYEGFLGFKNYGSSVKTSELSMKLEKGTWKITNEIYNKIKGTVILYDIDQRAATDYE